MHMCTSSMSITKHGMCVCVLIAPCVINFIMVDMEELRICISPRGRDAGARGRKGGNRCPSYAAHFLGFSSIVCSSLKLLNKSKFTLHFVFHIQ